MCQLQNQDQLAVSGGRARDRNIVCLVVSDGQKLFPIVGSALELCPADLLADRRDAPPRRFYCRPTLWSDPRSGERPLVRDGVDIPVGFGDHQPDAEPRLGGRRDLRSGADAFLLLPLVFYSGSRFWLWGCQTSTLFRFTAGVAENIDRDVHRFFDRSGFGSLPFDRWEKEIWPNHSLRTIFGLGDGRGLTLGAAALVLVLGLDIMDLMPEKSNGFTLMELLIVIAIMLILASVGFSNFIFSLKKSHDAKRKTDLSTIARGLESFANDWGDYPGDDAAGKMVACDYNNSSLAACDFGDAMAAFFPPTAQAANRALVTYIAEIPDDPVSGQTYYYDKTSTGYNLYAALENTADPSYAEVGILCGDVNCNYTLSQSGVQ